MAINGNNFEEYLLDYLEGNLDPVLTAELMAFLAENPELENLINEIHQPIVEPGDYVFDQKQLLRKDFKDIPEISENNFEEFCIADSEGLLNENDRLRLQRFMADRSERLNTYTLYQNLKLVPDLSVRFMQKQILKKNVAYNLRSTRVIYTLLAAAAIALLVLLFFRDTKPSGEIFTQEIINRGQQEKVFVPEFRQAKNPDQHQESIPQPSTGNDVLFQEMIPDNTTSLRDTIQLIALEPIEASEIKSAALPTLVSLANRPIRNPREKNEKPLPVTINLEKESFVNSLIARLDIWKTAETAVQGFNYLTEANVSINKTTDEDGNLTGLMLNTDRYSIKGNKWKLKD